MMGVFPEPALCADDVTRLVPCESIEAEITVASLSRNAAPTIGRSTKIFPLARRTVATLIVGLSLGSGMPEGALAPVALAREQTDERALKAQTRSDLRTDDKPSEWGGVPLLNQEPATLALIEGDLAALAPAASASDDESLRFGEMSVPRRVVEPILRASAETGVDPVYMMALADKESSFDVDVKSSASSAQGLFQFVTGTWLEMIRDYGAKHGLGVEAAAVRTRGNSLTIASDAMRQRVLDLRNDPYIAAVMAGELINRDRARIEQRLGRGLKTTELYLAHFLGTASARRFLTLSAENPDKVAEQEFRNAARANRTIFTEKDGKRRRSLTVAEVYERIDDMIDRRLDRYESVAALAATMGAPQEAGADARIQDASLRTDTVAPGAP